MKFARCRLYFWALAVALSCEYLSFVLVPVLTFWLRNWLSTSLNLGCSCTDMDGLLSLVLMLIIIIAIFELIKIICDTPSFSKIPAFPRQVRVLKDLRDCMLYCGLWFFLSLFRIVNIEDLPAHQRCSSFCFSVISIVFYFIKFVQYLSVFDKIKGLGYIFLNYLRIDVSFLHQESVERHATVLLE